MKAPALKQDRAAPDLPRHQFSSMTGDLGNREPRNRGISQAPGTLHARRETAQPRTEYDGGGGLQAVQPLSHRSGRSGDLLHAIPSSSAFAATTSSPFCSVGRNADSKALSISRSISDRVN